MPGGNKMGPEGRGPLTGRRMGLCVGNNVSDFTFRSEFEHSNYCIYINNQTKGGNYAKR